MVNPAQDWPDFTRATLLVGVDAAGDPIGVLVDSDGNMQALLKGTTALGALEAIRVDDDGQLIMIPRGATGNYLDVDANGFLTAVLKGVFAGVLHTIAVDVNGRLEAFVLDGESQWGQVLRVGNAELAARLGSPVSWDWRGNVLLLNTFGSGKGAIAIYESGTGSSVTISPTTSLTDGFSLHCEGGDAAGDYAGYDGRLGISPSGRFGFAVAWAPDGNFEEILIQLWINDGDGGQFASLKWTRANYDLEYLDEDNNYQFIADVTAPIGTWAFSRAKLVVDVETNMYVRALWNGVEYDLSAYALRPALGLASGTLEYRVRVYPGATAQTGVYVDHHIVTVNEPDNS